MMLIIMDKDPARAVELLIRNTSKQFCFKQLIELGQLICSAGISDVYKRIPQGKEIQNWIKQNPGWVLMFMSTLYRRRVTEGFQNSTLEALNTILFNLRQYWFENTTSTAIRTGIWRYKKSYASEYTTNSELPIDLVTGLYINYITKFKFPRKMTDIYR